MSTQPGDRLRAPSRARRAGSAVLSGALLIALAAAPAYASAATGGKGGGGAHGTHTWYVSATAAPGGDGTLGAPFGSLAAVQAASAPGDTIVVLPSPAAAPPLDGGIQLKPDQKLIGAGPPVLKPSGGPDNSRVVVSAGLPDQPVITNTANTTNNGDAVDMASGTEVTNLVIDGSFRGGIYGLNVDDATVRGNDISGQNTSATLGLLGQPFVAPSYTPGLDLGGGTFTIPAGWGAILFDATQATSRVMVDGNYVHDGGCGNGIDVEASGTADVMADIDSNFATRLPECASRGIRTVDGIFLLAVGSATERVSATGNTQADIGSAGADSEGLVTDLTGSAVITENVDRNTFANGIGGTSANGLEIIGSSGHPTADIRVARSSFDQDPGDMIEELNWGVGSTMRLSLDDVSVENTTITGGVPPYALPPGTAAFPFNLGECVAINQNGAGDVTDFQMTRSHVSGCDNDAIAVTSNLGKTPVAQGTGAPQAVNVSIDKSSITGSRYYNLWVNNLTPLGRVAVKVQDSDLATSTAGVPVAFDQQPTGTTGSAQIDLGGGALGSAGNNCIFGGALLDLHAAAYDVEAQHDWWGAPGGPAPGRTSGTVDSSYPLNTAPAACRQ